jgi:hypothetical protein
VLLVLVVLTGFSRGFIAAADASTFAGAGFFGPICHAHAGEAPNPAGRESPAAHDCCDECALCAPAALPGAVAVGERVLLALVISREIASWSLSDSPRTRTPRQAQAPPDARLI